MAIQQTEALFLLYSSNWVSIQCKKPPPALSASQYKLVQNSLDSEICPCRYAIAQKRGSGSPMYAAMHCSKSLNSISFSTEIHNSIETLDGRNLSLMYHAFFFPCMTYVSSLMSSLTCR